MNKIVKKTLASAVISCLAIAAMPVPVLAASSGHPQITSEIELDFNGADTISCVTENSHSGDPCWQYDYGTKILTLNGVDSNTTGYDGGFTFDNEGEVTVVLQDGSTNNIVTNQRGISNMFRSSVPKLSLTFKGNGTLNVTSSYDCIYADNDITINSGTFNLNSTNIPNDSNASCIRNNLPGSFIKINDGVINATNNSSLDATISADTSPDQIFFNGGKITIKNNSGEATNSAPILGAGMLYDSVTGKWSKPAPPAPPAAPAAPQAGANAPTAPTALIKSGANKSFSRGRSASFSLEGRTEDFSGVWVDGAAIAQSSYIISDKSSDSQTVSLTPQYSKTLPNGIHGIRFIYGNGGAYAEFTIADTADTNGTASKPNPQTGVTAEMLR